MLRQDGYGISHCAPQNTAKCASTWQRCYATSVVLDEDRIKRLVELEVTRALLALHAAAALISLPEVQSVGDNLHFPAVAAKAYISRADVELRAATKPHLLVDAKRGVHERCRVNADRRCAAPACGRDAGLCETAPRPVAAHIRMHGQLAESGPALRKPQTFGAGIGIERYAAAIRPPISATRTSASSQ